MASGAINRDSIAFEQDCRIPEGWVVCNLKICENCGLTFVRHSNIKFCASCCQRMLMPPTEELLREATPQLPHKSHHFVHYDDSLCPGKVVARVAIPLNRLGGRPSKVDVLINALKQQPLSPTEMSAVGSFKNRTSMWASVYQKGIKLVLVGHAWPRNGRKVPLYNLA